MAKTIDIYWAPVGSVSTVHSMNLLLEPPQRFWHNIPDKSDNIQGDYRACKAAQNMMMKLTPFLPVAIALCTI